MNETKLSQRSNAWTDKDQNAPINGINGMALWQGRIITMALKSQEFECNLFYDHKIPTS